MIEPMLAADLPDRHDVFYERIGISGVVAMACDDQDFRCKRASFP